MKNGGNSESAEIIAAILSNRSRETVTKRGRDLSPEEAAVIFEGISSGPVAVIAASLEAGIGEAS